MKTLIALLTFLSITTFCFNSGAKTDFNTTAKKQNMFIVCGSGVCVFPQVCNEIVDEENELNSSVVFVCEDL